MVVGVKFCAWAARKTKRLTAIRGSQKVFLFMLTLLRFYFFHEILGPRQRDAPFARLAEDDLVFVDGQDEGVREFVPDFEIIGESLGAAQDGRVFLLVLNDADQVDVVDIQQRRRTGLRLF